ncbi:acetaldehyde dehydrogenase (acetylating) [Pseudonocardia halophobica]|uniref:Acetaldehyde dehydrogenase (Acetylating) n=1 Tax=Pseudonocardia halophobica TaxID=29401 RepID=A0A9W6P0Y1_9PSEU|nr:aldehyde dehydrogenase family protein [Pseudonocardia halophobica]GLL15766.1 acetaldehyde dehydrogenase (acetylating) [Pseudonocardia halophobica]
MFTIDQSVEAGAASADSPAAKLQQEGVSDRAFSRGSAADAAPVPPVMRKLPPTPFGVRVQRITQEAEAAGETFRGWEERDVDELLIDISDTIVRAAKDLARRTVIETRMGNADDKAAKNVFASHEVCRSLIGRPAAGTLSYDRHTGIVETASPVGVIFGLIPVTNPVATIAFKTLIALKGRNALILSCHHRAHNVGVHAAELIRDALRRRGAPVGLLQCIERCNRATTMRFMRHPRVSMILATGSAGLVKAAYSSGKPAIGVGPGNAPALICADADVAAAAKSVVESKAFDNGVICGSENNLVVDTAVRTAFITALRAAGAAVLSSAETAAFTARAFDLSTGRLHRDLVGQSAPEILAATGIPRDTSVRLLVAPLPIAAARGPWGLEKLAPVLSMFDTEGAAAGIALCQKLLARNGIGHTAVIHTQSESLARRFGDQISASRIIVNSASAQGCIGIGNALPPSLTLGCGTWAGTSTTDNITYTHLLNIKRVVFSRDVAERPASGKLRPGSPSAPTKRLNALVRGFAPIHTGTLRQSLARGPGSLKP